MPPVFDLERRLETFFGELAVIAHWPHPHTISVQLTNASGLATQAHAPANQSPIDSGHCADIAEGPFRAISCRQQPQQKGGLFDHLVGALLQTQRHRLAP
jgi:hypothetical protein